LDDDPLCSPSPLGDLGSRAVRPARGDRRVHAGVVHRIARAVAQVPGLGFFGSGWIEFIANVVMFTPLGFLLTLLFRRAAVGASVGVAVSVCIELVQIVIPDRHASVRDVISNGIGAAIGALVAWLAVLRRRQSGLPETRTD
jgi:hypothetical protein